MCDNSLAPSPCENDASCGISSRFQLLFPSHRQVAHALLTRPPLFREPKLLSPFDLNVLGTPPAFILSQDQTLEKYLSVFRRLSSFRVLLPAIYSCTTFVLFPFRNCRDLLPFSSSEKSCCCLICCSIFKDQFRPLLGVACLVYYFSTPLSIPFFIFFGKICLIVALHGFWHDFAPGFVKFRIPDTIAVASNRHL